jgi:hypothetical protein
MEWLSDASFLCKLLVLPANVRVDWKVIARYNHSSLFGLVVSMEGKTFYNIDTSGLYYTQFTNVIYDRNAIGQYYKTKSTTIVVKAS